MVRRMDRACRRSKQAAAPEPTLIIESATDRYGHMNPIVDQYVLEADDSRPAPRPPWAIAEWAFVGRCDGCQACVDACREDVLRPGPDGLVVADFSFGGCDFCGACLDACDRGALRGDLQTAAPAFRFAIAIGADCLSSAGEDCRTCLEFCDSFAIRFDVSGPGAIGPMVLDSCSGCGACVGPCPVGCIKVYRPAPPGSA